MNTFQEAKSRATKQRQLLSKAREQVQRRKEELSKRQKEIPDLSQRNLRSGVYAGLNGRKRRRESKTQVGKILGEIKSLKQRKRELNRFEEQELAPYEKEISRVERERSAFRKAVDIASSKNPAAVFSLQDDPLARKYFQAIEKTSIAKTRETLPGVSVSFDPLKYEAIGSTESGTLLKPKSGTSSIISNKRSIPSIAGLNLTNLRNIKTNVSSTNFSNKKTSSVISNKTSLFSRKNKKTKSNKSKNLKSLWRI